MDFWSISDVHLSLTFAYLWCSSIFNVRFSFMFTYLWCSFIFDVRLTLTFAHLWCSIISDVRLSLIFDYSWYSISSNVRLPWSLKLEFSATYLYPGKPLFTLAEPWRGQLEESCRTVTIRNWNCTLWAVSQWKTAPLVFMSIYGVGRCTTWYRHGMVGQSWCARWRSEGPILPNEYRY